MTQNFKEVLLGRRRMSLSSWYMKRQNNTRHLNVSGFVRNSNVRQSQFQPT